MDYIVSRLQNISIFGALKNDEVLLIQIAGIMKIEKFNPNTYIIHEGEIGNKMYILNKGKVKVERNTPSKDQFTVAILDDSMNVCFGELALMDNDVRSASVLSVTETECYVINKLDFEKICEHNPKIGYLVMREIGRALSQRFRKSASDNMQLIEALIKEEEVF